MAKKKRQQTWGEYVKSGKAKVNTWGKYKQEQEEADQIYSFHKQHVQEQERKQQEERQKQLERLQAKRNEDQFQAGVQKYKNQLDTLNAANAGRDIDITAGRSGLEYEVNVRKPSGALRGMLNQRQSLRGQEIDQKQALEGMAKGPSRQKTAAQQTLKDVGAKQAENERQLQEYMRKLETDREVQQAQRRQQEAALRTARREAIRTGNTHMPAEGTATGIRTNPTLGKTDFRTASMAANMADPDSRLRRTIRRETEQSAIGQYSGMTPEERQKDGAVAALLDYENARRYANDHPNTWRDLDARNRKWTAERDAAQGIIDEADRLSKTIWDDIESDQIRNGLIHHYPLAFQERPKDYEQRREEYDRKLYNAYYNGGHDDGGQSYDGIMRFGSDEAKRQLQEKLDDLWKPFDSGTMKRLYEIDQGLHNRDAEIAEAESRLGYANDQLQGISAEINARGRYTDLIGKYRTDDSTYLGYIPANDRGREAYGSMAEMDRGAQTSDVHRIYSFINGGTEFESWANTFRKAGTTPQITSEYSNAAMMTEEEQGYFNNLYNQGKYSEASAFLSGLQMYLNERYSQYEAIRTQEAARKMPALASAASLAAGTANTFIAPVRTVAGWLGDESVRDPNGKWYAGSRQKEMIQGTIENDLGGTLGKTYQVVMNSAQNVINGLVTGGLGLTGKAQEAASLAGFFGQVYQDSTYRYLKETGDYDQASALGFLDGMMETFEEMLPYEAMLGTGTNPVRYFFNNVLSEAGEELTGSTVGERIKGLITGRDSTEKRADEIYHDGGYYDASGKWIALNGRDKRQALYEADMQALREFRQEAIDSAIAGAAGGGTGAMYGGISYLAGTTSAGRRINSSTNTNKGKSGKQQLLEIASGMRADTKSRQLAETIMKGNAREMTNYETGRLAQTIMEDTDAEIGGIATGTVERVAREALTGGGMAFDRANEAAPVIAKAATEGMRALNAEETAILRGNPQAMELAKSFLSSKGSVIGAVAQAEAAADTAEQRAIQQKVTNLANGQRTQLLSASAADVRAAAQAVQLATDADLRMVTAGKRTDTGLDVVAGDEISQIRSKSGSELTLANGKTVDIADVKATGDKAGLLIEFARRNPGKISDGGFNAMIEEIGNNRDAQAGKFVDDAMNVYIRGRLGMQAPGSTLNRRSAEKIYQAAQADTDAADQARMRRGQVRLERGKGTAALDGAQYGTQEFTQKIKDMKLSWQSRRDVMATAEVAVRLGMQVDFVNSDNPDIFGWEEGSTGRVTINIGARNENGDNRSLLTIASHEFTHWIEQNSHETYNELRSFVFDRMERDGTDVTARIMSTIDNYRVVAGQELDIAGAMAEIVANASDQVLGNENVIRELQETKPTLYGKVKQFVKDFVGILRSAARGMNGSSTVESRAMMKYADELAEKWLGAYHEASGRNNEATTKESGKAQLSIQQLSNGRQYVEVDTDQDIFDGAEPREYSRIVEKYIKNHFRGRPIIDSDQAIVTGKSAKEYAKRSINVNSAEYQSKAKASTELNNLFQIAKPERLNVPDDGSHEEAISWDYYKTILRIGGRFFEGTLNVMNRKYDRILYDMNKIRDVTDYVRQMTESEPVTSPAKNIPQRQLAVNQKIDREMDADYQRAVADGDMAAAQRMVDEAAAQAGYTMKVYHGTPYGGFTRFRDWSYFTENEDYAKRYRNPSASSIRGRYDEASGPMTYELYMNPGRVFDTRKAKERKLYDQARMEYGMGALSETDSGLPDWTNGRDLIDYIEENDLPYDTIILDEGGDIIDGKPVKRGLSYVSRATRIKSAASATYDDQNNLIPLSERFKEDNPDIRYSLQQKRQKNIEGAARVSTVDDIDKVETDPNVPSDRRIIENNIPPVNTDEEYFDAVARGDLKAATEMLMNKLEQSEEIVPFIAPKWDSGKSREIARLIKEGSPEAIAKAAGEMAEYVPENAVLIPMPNHTGKVTETTDTALLAEAISKLTGRPVVYAIEGAEHESRHLAKARNERGASQAELGYRQVKAIPEGTFPVFIDNIVGKGITADAAREAMGGGITLAYTKTLRSPGIIGLKNAVITYDKNGELIPLSQRFDRTRRDVRYAIQQGQDMDVRRFMEGLQETSLDTIQEKTMLRQYKELNTALGVTRMAIREREKKIAELQAKGNLDYKERELIRKYNALLENDRKKLDRLQKDMIRVTSSEGYAGLMYRQSQLMRDMVEGRTADDVKETVEAMNRRIDEIGKQMQAREKEILALAEDLGVKKIRTLVDEKSLGDMAAMLRKQYNSKANKTELMNDLLAVRLKMEQGVTDIDADLEGIAWKVISGIGGETDPVLEALRGMTLTLGPGQVKEIYGSGSRMKEVRSLLAGTGIKVTQGKTSGLDANWDELRKMVPELEDVGEKDQVKAILDLVTNRKAAQAEYGKRQYGAGIDEVKFDVLGMIAGIKTNMPKDPAAYRVLEKMSGLMNEVAAGVKTSAKELEAARSQMRELIAQGRMAGEKSDSMRRDIQKTIEYFNKLGEQSEAAFWRRERAKLIAELKSENTQKLLAEKEKYRQKLEKDRTARGMMADNMQIRRRIHTNVDRVRKLLVNETDIKNIPEHMKGLAREMLGMFVTNDLSGLKVTGIEHKDLVDTMNLLNAWKEQDGEFDLDDLKMISDEEAQTVVMDALADIEDGIKFYNNAGGGDRISNLQALKNALNRIQDGTVAIMNIISAERSISFMDRRVLLEDAAEDIIRDFRNSRHRGELAGRGSKAVRAVSSSVVSGNTTPVYFFKNLRNKGMNDQWKELQRGENRNGIEMAKARDYIAELAARTNYRNWDHKAEHTVILGGQKVKMTTENMMALYATWKREHTSNPEMSNHLALGGVYIDNGETTDGKLHREKAQQRPYRVTDAEIAAMYAMMPEEQKQYIEGMVKYLSNEMSDLGNEASMRMYGIRKYKETYYFPMKVWDGVKSARSDKGISGTTENRAAHRSWSKRRKNKASNALVIGGFTDTAVQHIVEMINYNTMSPAIENINKVLNYQTTEGETPDTQTKRNVRIMFQEAYGKDALGYLETFLKDLNGGTVQDQRRTLRDRALSMFKKNAVAGSASVALQQPLSYIRAAMMISPKYLAQAIGPTHWKGSYAEMMKHSGVAVIKDMGRFDMGLGQSAREFIRPETKGNLYETVSDLVTAAPELMDRMTWTRMWSAVKLEQKAKHPEMDISSDAFLDMVGERFNEVMRRTQVYDSVMVKSSNMRSQNYALKVMTSFMAEPTLSLNVLADAVRNAGEKGGKGTLAAAGATFLLSAVMQAAVKGLMGSGRSPDDKKTWLENFLYKWQYNFQNEANPMSLIPGYGDVIELLKNGELKDDAMSTVGKLKSIIDTTGKALRGEGKGAWLDLEDTIGQFAQLFTNIPAKNLSRDVRAIRNWIVGDRYAQRENSDAVKRYQAEATFWNADNLLGTLNAWLGEAGFQTTNKAYYSRIFGAMKSGNDAEAEDIREYLTLGKGLKDQTTIDNAVKKMIAADYADEGMTQEQAEKMLTKLFPGKEKKDIAQILDLEVYKAETGDTEASGYYYRLKDTITDGKLKEYQAEKKRLIASGLKEDDVNEKTETYIKQQYKEGKADKKKTQTMLKEFCGLNENDIWWGLDRIDYQKETKAEKAQSGYYYRFNDALAANDLKQIQKAVKDLLAHGITKEKIKTQISSELKQKWIAGTEREKVTIRDAMNKAYKATGYTVADAQKIVEGWIKEAKKAKTTKTGSGGNDSQDTTGRWGEGNIDLNNRKVVRNSDGSISTEYSFSVGFDDKVVLLPRVVNGKIVSEEEAIDHYLKTGEYLGEFDTGKEADEYAEKLHNRQDWYYNKRT